MTGDLAGSLLVNVWQASSSLPSRLALASEEEESVDQMTLGIDAACRAAHQASLADEQGRFAWTGRRFRTTAADLERLWAQVPAGVALTVVMEPTRNAWVPLAAWFRRRGAVVILVPPEQSADLRDYYSKHAKSDHLDSRMLARLPLLHPEGLRPSEGLGPADGLRRATKLRASLVKRRSAILARLDAYLELLGPAWHAALGGDLALNTPPVVGVPVLCAQVTRAVTRVSTL